MLFPYIPVHICISWIDNSIPNRLFLTKWMSISYKWQMHQVELPCNLNLVSKDINFIQGQCSNIYRSCYGFIPRALISYSANWTCFEEGSLSWCQEICSTTKIRTVLVLTRRRWRYRKNSRRKNWTHDTRWMQKRNL